MHLKSAGNAYFHDAVPVVTRGNAKQREKGHAEVLEVRMFVQSAARVIIGAFQFAEQFHAECSEDEEQKKEKKALNDDTNTVVNGSARRQSAYQVAHLWKCLNDRVQQCSNAFCHLQQLQY